MAFTKETPHRDASRRPGTAVWNGSHCRADPTASLVAFDLVSGSKLWQSAATASGPVTVAGDRLIVLPAAPEKNADVLAFALS
ncbi:hypothetical protein [Catenulispora pinisilvae]|uniref:hypothetical protein n=1 Tax=Catenulispora pinisilvae TaxID=2705253 RepID=UPI0018925BF4|nr:hypothetical protein [Catenulispora pinisilvae]